MQTKFWNTSRELERKLVTCSFGMFLSMIYFENWFHSGTHLKEELVRICWFEGELFVLARKSDSKWIPLAFPNVFPRDYIKCDHLVKLTKPWVTVRVLCKYVFYHLFLAFLKTCKTYAYLTFVYLEGSFILDSALYLHSFSWDTVFLWFTQLGWIWLYLWVIFL